MEYSDRLALKCIEMATGLPYGSKCCVEYLQRAKDSIEISTRQSDLNEKVANLKIKRNGNGD